MVIKYINNIKQFMETSTLDDCDLYFMGFKNDDDINDINELNSDIIDTHDTQDIQDIQDVQDVPDIQVKKDIISIPKKIKKDKRIKMTTYFNQDSMHDICKSSDKGTTHLFSSVFHQINKYVNPIFLISKNKYFNNNDKTFLIESVINILYHCSLLWSGKYGYIVKFEGNLQLPKDYIIRVCASVIYVIKRSLNLIKSFNINEIMIYFFKINRNKREFNKFLYGVYSFMSVIQEFRLGTVKYLKNNNLPINGIENNIEINNDSHVFNRVSIDHPFHPCITDITVVDSYIYLRKCFFFRYPLYSIYEIESENLFKRITNDVLLEGKGPKFTLPVSIYYIVFIDLCMKLKNNEKLKLKNIDIQHMLRHSRKNKKYSFDMESQEYIDIVKTNEILTTLYTDILDFFMLKMEMNVYGLERNKQRLNRCINKFFKTYKS
jgi:hypothetical protein